MFYSLVLFVHSSLRWLVLIFAALVLFRSWQARGGAYTASHKKASTLFIATLHANVVLGLVMYGVLSPVTELAFNDPAAAMKSSLLRFFFVEHLIGMLASVILATIGSARIKRATSDQQKHKLTLVFYGISLLLIFASIPWPFYPAGRPLLPAF